MQTRTCLCEQWSSGFGGGAIALAIACHHWWYILDDIASYCMRDDGKAAISISRSCTASDPPSLGTSRSLNPLEINTLGGHVSHQFPSPCYSDSYSASPAIAMISYVLDLRLRKTPNVVKRRPVSDTHSTNPRSNESRSANVTQRTPSPSTLMGTLSTPRCSRSSLPISRVNHANCPSAYVRLSGAKCSSPTRSDVSATYFSGRRCCSHFSVK